MSKKYNQNITEKDIIDLFKIYSVVSKKLICSHYNVSLYRVNAVLESMENLKITNHGFKLK